MKLLKRFKSLKASSIVESVIAIAIISICVLIAFMVYINISKQKTPLNYYKAKHHIEVLIHDIEHQKDYENDIFTYRGYTIAKTVDVDAKEGIARVLFLITIGGHKVYEIIKVIPYKES